MDDWNEDGWFERFWAGVEASSQAAHAAVFEPAIIAAGDVVFAECGRAPAETIAQIRALEAADRLFTDLIPVFYTEAESGMFVRGVRWRVSKVGAEQAIADTWEKFRSEWRDKAAAADAAGLLLEDYVCRKRQADKEWVEARTEAERERYLAALVVAEETIEGIMGPTGDETADGAIAQAAAMLIARGDQRAPVAVVEHLRALEAASGLMASAAAATRQMLAAEVAGGRPFFFADEPFRVIYRWDDHAERNWAAQVEARATCF
jgi:hypothetical protein